MGNKQVEENKKLNELKSNSGQSVATIVTTDDKKIQFQIAKEK